MKQPHSFIVAASIALAFASTAIPATAATATSASPAVLDASNPFARVSALPFHYPAFDKIKDEHFRPAFEVGMRVHLLEIEAIANNRSAPSFENTIVAMERSGQLLARVSTTFSNLQGANTNDNLDAIDREMSPKLAAHADAIYMNDKLWKRVKALYDKRDSLKLDAESKHLLERYHRDFVRAGARLSAANKAKLKAYNGEIASLQSTFAQNVLKEANASSLMVDTRAELAGLSDAEIDAAAAEAKKRGMDGKFVIALANTTGQPLLSSLSNRTTRERLMAVSLARGSRGGEFDSRQLVQRLTRLRAEKAVLLGYPNYAAYSLEVETAKTPEAVNKLLGELALPAVNNARKEAAEIQSVIDAEAGKPEGGFQVAAHDWAFYTDKVRQARYAFDESQLKPYFELNNVVQNGVFFAANKEFGISFRERHDLPVYDPDVRVFDVFDADGKQLAIFIMDYYARPNKQGGAWMNEYVTQSALLGNHPVVANHLNIPKPPAGQPTLLTYDEVRTAFHEFGHALHGMFSNVKYPTFGGANTPRDFVEYPSQVNEMWATWPEVLANYARHYQTGEPMPQALLDKVQASKKFNMGYITTEYLAASLLDQRWHQLAPSQIPSDVLGFEARALHDAGVDFAPVPPRYRTTYFSHSFSLGYSAGYYAYLWSEKLDADTVEWFKENGGLLRKNGDHFRQTLLSRGGSLDAMDLFRNFRGRDARIEPLLERRGLTGN
ncbi:dipeptidyl carboxypeptidase II [Massilia sp. WF1]|uniref:M3 family metallopeptidase n=1 Tax=unclassified Massilia TaxID=2609279 RepID=UPI00064A00D8|nr:MULTISPECIES: M3 family metallopeptidase [unclassified Massilia]ALK94956.1 dipeptidyl carboxypeptidase [Massilia sp. WG5]KLU38375.1 dipeptidyl carboxypeptidase II [Massilia sp. WF1]